MTRDFFDGLGETISKKTRELGKMAGQIYETQKIRSKVSSEEHMIAKLKNDIGNYIYEKYQNGEEVEDALKGFCEEIQQHQEIIAGYKDSEAELKGQKICRSCGNSVDRSVSYCPYCGSPCPVPAPKEEPVTEPKEEPVTKPEEKPVTEPESQEAVQQSCENIVTQEEMKTEPGQTTDQEIEEDAAPEAESAAYVPETEPVTEAETAAVPESESQETEN